MKSYVFALLAAACAPCWPQSTVTFMPEGSRDVRVGAQWGATQRFQGSREVERYLSPYFGIRWSNGIFIEGLALGAELSRTPQLQYGPLLMLGYDADRGAGEPGGRKLVAGGYAGYQVLHNLGVRATLLYGDARGGDGSLLTLRARNWFPLAPHHFAAFELGVNLADRHYMRSHFGASADGGVKDVFAKASWSWQISRKYHLRTAIGLNRLDGNVGASRVVETRYGADLSTAVLYQF